MRRSDAVSPLMIAILAAATVAACAPRAPERDAAADIAALREAHAREAAALSTGSVDTMMSVYDAEVVMMPPGEPAKNGGSAVREWIERSLGDVSISGESTADDVQVAGDWGIVRYTGTLTITPKAGGQAMTEKIKGIHVFRRQADGSWKIAQDVWNTDAPPPPPPQPPTTNRRS